MKILIAAVVVQFLSTFVYATESTLTVTCQGADKCADKSIKELKSKYNCKVASSESNIGGKLMYFMVIENCQVKNSDRSADNLCPGGTQAVGISDEKLLKICLPSQPSTAPKPGNAAR